MQHVNRLLENRILEYLQPNKVMIILGARRVGKTELVKQILKKVNEKMLVFNGEDQDVHQLLHERSIRNYKQLLGDTKLLVIDEAQAIPEIGLKLKLMIDTIEGLKIIVTGSSVFDLGNQLGEPLVGRAYTFHLYPISEMELLEKENYFEVITSLNNRLIYGGYPELMHLETNERKEAYLKEQVNSYLLKDILAFEGIRKQAKIVALLRIIAFRVGSEISMESIGRDLDLSKNTIERYLDLLSKVFVIYNLRGFARNLDNEITKKSKWYFYDNGVRNAIINNFNSIDLRDDQGKLWENYLVAERLKYQEYQRKYASNYFWRTHTQQEIDWVEEKNGQINAYEFKWGNKKAKIPALWAKNYPEATFETVNQWNYHDFITQQ